MPSLQVSQARLCASVVHLMAVGHKGKAGSKPEELNSVRFSPLSSLSSFLPGRLFAYLTEEDVACEWHGRTAILTAYLK